MDIREKIIPVATMEKSPDETRVAARLGFVNDIKRETNAIRIKAPPHFVGAKGITVFSPLQGSGYS